MSEERQRVPVEQLRVMPEFLRLTPKQQLFVAAYCDGGMLDGHYDPVAATRIAYQCKSPESARTMSYAIMSNIRIVEVLNRHFGREPIEAFLTVIDRAINNKKLTNAQVQALRLKCDVLGYASRLPLENQGVRIPADVAEASRAARKSRRKSPTRPPVIESPSTASDDFKKLFPKS